MGFYSNKRIDKILMLGIRTGAAIKRAEIIGSLQQRKLDLESCGCDEDCVDMARFVGGLIDDLNDEARTDWDEWMNQNG